MKTSSREFVNQKEVDCRDDNGRRPRCRRQLKSERELIVLFGQFLILQGLATPVDIEAALARQRIQGGRIGENLVAMGVMSADTLEWALNKFFTDDATSWRSEVVSPVASPDSGL